MAFSASTARDAPQRRRDDDGMRPALVATAYVKEGRLFVPKRPAFDAAVGEWPNCGAVIRLEQQIEPRSVALNAYLWGVVYHLISEETGMSPDEVHEEMKQLHFPKRFAAVRGIGRIENGRVFGATITKLSNQEQWEVIEKIQQWAAEVLDLVIPDPVLV